MKESAGKVEKSGSSLNCLQTTTDYNTHYTLNNAVLSDLKLNT